MMATTFYSTEAVDAKPQHTGTVIYADETCIRVLSSELLGGGGGIEHVGVALMFLELLLLPFVGVTEDVGRTFAIWMFGGAIFFITLPILLFRHKPNYPIFSRKSQEIYYVKSPKNIIKFNWADVKAEYRRVSVFTGSAVSQIDTLTLIGTSQYGNKPASPAVIQFVVLDEENAKEFWAYLQAYMKNGAEGLESPSTDKFNKGGFIAEAKSQTKMWLSDYPRHYFKMIFNPKSIIQFFFSIIFLAFSPMLILLVLLIFWPGQIATAFVNSTRKRAPIPDDILPNITDNPESWGKEKA